MAAEIVTLVAGGFAGPHRSLQALERCTGLTAHHRLTRNDAAGPELDFYVQMFRKSPPQMILLGGWCALYDALVRRLGRTTIRFGVWWLSTAGQTDMSREMDRLQSAIENTRVEHFGFAQKSLAESLSGYLADSVYLPVPMFPEEFPVRAPRKSGPAVLSLFCSPHEYHRKNILNTLLAIAQLDDEYVLALNGLSRDRWYRRMLQRLGIRYADTGWMTDEAYGRKLETVDIGIQVSFTESFNQVAAEHALRGIPVVASAAVPSLAGLRGSDRRRLIVDDPEDPAQIAGRLCWLLRHPRSARQLGQRANQVLRRQIERNNLIAKQALRKWLSDNRSE